jgi:hypothetical protein
MSKYLASKNSIPKFGGGGSPGSSSNSIPKFGGGSSSSDDSDASYDEVLAEVLVDDGSSSSDSSEEMNIMSPIEESEREESGGSSSSTSSDDNDDFNASYTDMFFKKEDPNKKTAQTVVGGTFDDVNEGRPPAKKTAKSVPVTKDNSPSKAKSGLAEKKTDDNKWKITSEQKKADDKKVKSAIAEKKIDDKKAKSAAAEKKADSKKEKIAMTVKKTNEKKEMSTSVEMKTDDKKVKSISAEKKPNDKKGTSSSDEKNADDKKEKIASAKKKTVDKKEKSASDEKKVYESKVKLGSAQKERDGQTSDVKNSPLELVPPSETIFTAEATLGKTPLFGSWNQNVEEEVLFVTQEPDEPVPRRSGLGMFGSIRRHRSQQSLDKENPDGPASTDGSIKEKKGMFGSLRRHKSLDSLDQVNPEVPVEAETNPDEGETNATLPASEIAPSIEAVKEKKGMFGSLHRISRDSLDEENPALATDNEDSSREMGDKFGGSLGELPMDETALDENYSIKKDRPNRFLSPFRRSKAANEVKTFRVLAVPDGDASYEEESPANIIPDGDQRKAVTYRQLGVALILAVLLLVGTNIGTSYLGAKLALENFGEKSVIGEKSVVDDKIAGNVTGPCAFEDVHLEFKIRFDSNPGETGAVLRDKGPIGATLWNFGVGAFFSFSQFQRENFFSVCLSPALPYEFELTDLGGDGLVGSFIDSAIYGNWQLMYNGELVARYHGDCNEPDLTHCGDFCSCKYSLSADGSEGGCETICAETV